MRSREGLWRRLVLMVVAVVAVLGLGVGPASAQPVDEEELRAEAESAGQEAVAELICGQVPFLEGQPAEQCIQAVAAAVDYDTVMGGANAMCDVVGGAVPVFGSAACRALINMDQVQSVWQTAYDNVMGAAESVRDGIDDAVAAVQFIANPESAFQEWLNDMYADAVGFFWTAVEYAVDSTAFEGDSAWWRTAFAANAGLGILVLAIMLLLVFRQASSGKISGEELGAILSQTLPLYVVLTVFGPAIGYVAGWATSGLTDVMMTWTGSSVEDLMSLTNILTVASSTALPGGIVTGLLLILAMFIGGASLLATLILMNLSTYVLGAIAAIAFALMVHPRWRRKALAVPTAFLGLLLARPALFLVFGIIAMFLNNELEEARTAAADLDPVTLLISALTLVLAVIVVGFSPIAVLRWFPLLPEGGDSVSSPGGGSAVVSGGMSAAEGGLQRAQMRASGGGGGRGAPAVSRSSPGRSRGGSTSPAGRSDGGTAGTGTGGRSAAGRGGSRTAGAGAKAGGGAKAAGAAKSAGAVAGGVATAGALFAAHVGLSAAKSGIDKAQRIADTGTPQLQEREWD